jgi:hypothetical protein
MNKKNLVVMSVLLSLSSLVFMFSVSSGYHGITIESRPAAQPLQADGDPVPPFPNPWHRNLSQEPLSA